MDDLDHCLRPMLGRRQFVLGSASAGVLGLAGGWSGRLAAQGVGPEEIRGNMFDLSVEPRTVNLTGRDRMATTINGGIPGPTLRWRQGDEVTLRVTNRLARTTSIHWHGILLPWQMDGVPGLSFDGIAPGATFTYRFRVNQSGTYWYHSHSGFQEQTGMYGALIVDPAGRDAVDADREHVVLLSDWTDEDPMRVFARLKKNGHYYNDNQRTLRDIRDDIRRAGFAGNRDARRMWNRMRMTDRDISDVTGATYTYLMNGQPPAANWSGLFSRGERVRLRVINGSAMTIFDLRIPGLEMTVVAADGQNVEPVTVDELRIGVAETYDVIVRPSADTAYTVFAQAIDRSGFARGTLAPALGLSAPVPELDARPVLTMTDMGMAMSIGQGMNMAMGADHAAMGHDQAATAADHAAMGHDQAATAADHAAMGHDHAAMGPGDGAMSGTSAEFPGPRAAVDMRAESPQPRYDDPGVGLRQRSWRVLTYGMLQRLRPSTALPAPGREIELHLTGNMMRYMWSMDGVRFADADPIGLRRGETVTFALINDTMMNHPIHLHGMWSDVQTSDAGQVVRKHTVIVQPGQVVRYNVTADAPGPWAFHCHLLYHMDAGMFRVVDVA
jgi:CopA family copper-resistance protein